MHAAMTHFLIPSRLKTSNVVSRLFDSFDSNIQSCIRYTVQNIDRCDFFNGDTRHIIERRILNSVQ